MSSHHRKPDAPRVERRLLDDALGVRISDTLLERALTHRSYAYENGGLPTNERLEFLGDAVLGLVVTDALYRRHPDLPEGQLAKLRAAVVNMRALAEIARGLGEGGLGAHVRLGRGEETSGGRDKSSILADTLEALFGAVYLEHGIDCARTTVHRLVDPMLESSATLGAGLDWKTSLQELTAAAGLGVPEYQVSEEGPDHAKLFHAVAVVQGSERGAGSGRSKKEAEQRAAAAAFKDLKEAEEAADQDGRVADGEDARTDEGAAVSAATGVVPVAALPDETAGHLQSETTGALHPGTG
ncbi:MAG: ribonuclease III [Actinomycetales bacterium]|nr:ribonuclease III [Actinomycetales bacterium]